MVVNSAAFKGDSNVGAYALPTSKFVIASKNIMDMKNIELLTKTLNVPIVLTDISGSRLVGVLLAGNSSTLFVPFTIRPEEHKILTEECDAKIVVLESRKNAIGNLVVLNDKGVILSPVLSEKSRQIILDETGLPGEVMEIAGLATIGAAIAVNNRAAIVHPKASDEEIAKIKEILKLDLIERGTVNGGIPYVRSGIIVNDSGAVIGMDCTGMELMRIYSTFET